MPHKTGWERNRSNERNIGKGLVAGAIGGLAGTWAMTQFMSQMQKVQSETRSPQEQEKNQETGPQTEADREAQQLEREQPTVKVARAVSTKVLRMPLREGKKQVASNIVHYGFGTLSGAIYGVLAEISPKLRRTVGLPFGASVWFAADELALPALKLTARPQYHPVSEHASALAAHLIYGFTTDVVRRGVRRAWGEKESAAFVSAKVKRMRRECAA